MDKYFFVGNFSSNDYQKSIANSSAGNQVQFQILNEINKLGGTVNTICYSMQPMPAWPKGDFIVRSKKESNIVFPRFINLPIIKNLFFALHLILFLLKYRPKYCVQYNSYLFENLALLLYRFFIKKSRISIIIQDVNCDPVIKFQHLVNVKYLIERLGLYLIVNYDFLVPVSEELALDFRFKKEKYFVFQGGMTSYSFQLLNSQVQEQLSDNKFAVFAGAIEPYNGLKKLIDQWIFQEVKFPLHIFGRGSMSEYVKTKAKENQYIIYHGFQSEEIVEQWLLQAQWNFCLRYSIEINQNYFFPSKFFNLICLKNTLICNQFNNLPLSLRSFIVLIDDELQNLSDIINSTVNANRFDKSNLCTQTLFDRHSWETCINNLCKNLNV